MVYSCGVREPYEYTVNRELIGATWGALEEEVDYVNPDEIDAIAALPGKNKLEQGYRVNPKNVPKKLLWGDSRKAVPDFVNAPCPIVSERVKGIIEKLEPGVHQFIPIDLYHRKVTEPFARYYWFVICKLIDPIDEEKTTYELKMSPWAKGCGSYRGIDGSGRFIYSVRKIGSHHLWREKHGYRQWMISEPLADRFERDAIIGLSKVEKETV